LINNSREPFSVRKGDRIAQLIIEMTLKYQTLEVQELDETERGAGGFGSTGLRDDE
jgi:dUTP pyrophosphatase